MSETVCRPKSRFIATFRLGPERSFAGLKYQFTTKDGYDVSFHDHMVWIGFDASSDEWLRRLDSGSQALKTILAILTIQVEYPFEIERIQWLEDKPRDETGKPNYVLGRLGPELTVQQQAPVVDEEHMRKGEVYAHVASVDAYYRYALLDYSVALSFPREAIVFCARSAEWVQSHFDAAKRSRLGQEKLDSRKVMKGRLALPAKYLTEFFKIANQTVVARHAADPARVRPPTIEEIRFCVFFSRVVLDRFGAYLWHVLSEKLPSQWQWPSDEKPPREQFAVSNRSLCKTLRGILSGKLA